MRALIVKPISLIVILSWGAQNIAFGANPETTPKASANADDCRSICDEYRGGAVAGTASDSASNLQFSKEYVTSKCGTPATNSADTSGRKSSSNFIGQPGTEISKPSAGAANENEQGFDFNYQGGDKNFDA